MSRRRKNFSLRAWKSYVGARSRPGAVCGWHVSPCKTLCSSWRQRRLEAGGGGVASGTGDMADVFSLRERSRPATRGYKNMVTKIIGVI
ncbi:hypothetical protein EVAR_14708_1 [Eumeta japonica]|uniref:Uncharacterized protein n=1 Tax=Eumeta variegata TaxID=151549 RepID=A0A4C1U2F3_EUMVA|nr:hypothetical protein EVAR_14708_1 [Eumeta japonica]